ncbi:hypothetical protein PR202_ga28446 [Eleusine coracana subsp. coracana]|uniref:SCP domain-containing protein n=1 Tax=Eleusine coracana subsp. coracana TaxID=191504 RepID=A0AAV5DJ90_ELECO|nr:hypothetical protein QOZ80_7AG0554640 [Eleusine coracana subsp. coracana]GJN10358.1 hypothetical protein PR202_ga28446 [Eleusine coracana subsp. coracana]
MTAATAVTAQNSPQDYLDLHNAARAAVGVGPVTWDNTVAAWAQNYANSRRGDCALVHSPSGRPYGENLFGGTGGGWTARNAVKSWVDEKQYYNHDSNSCARGKMCGHYTQVVWRNTRAIGCARVICNNGGTFIICSYNPPGNFIGQRPY